MAFDGFAISLADGGVVSARTIVAACGARYRRLPLANWGRLEGAGIYYAATYLEAGLSADSPVFVLGGGNSAGQAALFLASRCPHVTIVIRRESLAATMSQYLIDRIEAHDQIDVAVSSVISAVNGLRHLESVELRDTRSGEVTLFDSRGLFCFIGAKPAGGWLSAKARPPSAPSTSTWRASPTATQLAEGSASEFLTRYDTIRSRHGQRHPRRAP